MARCDIPRAQCLNWHCRDHLRDAKPSGDMPGGVVQSYRALCPVPDHADSERSLSVSIGEKARIVWHCYARGLDGEPKCSPLAIRAALISDGCPAECLGMPKDDEQELIDQIIKLCGSEVHHSELRWRMYSLSQGFGGELPPKGRYLGGRRKFAHDAGVSAPDLYRHFNR